MPTFLANTVTAKLIWASMPQKYCCCHRTNERPFHTLSLVCVLVYVCVCVYIDTHPLLLWGGKGFWTLWIIYPHPPQNNVLVFFCVFFEKHLEDHAVLVVSSVQIVLHFCCLHPFEGPGDVFLFAWRPWDFAKIDVQTCKKISVYTQKCCDSYYHLLKHFGTNCLFAALHPDTFSVCTVGAISSWRKMYRLHIDASVWHHVTGCIE